MQKLSYWILLVALSSTLHASTNDGDPVNTDYVNWGLVGKVAKAALGQMEGTTGGKQQGTCDICAKPCFPDEGIVALGHGKKGYRHHSCDQQYRRHH
jgi:hypothetical protein